MHEHWTLFRRTLSTLGKHRWTFVITAAVGVMFSSASGILASFITRDAINAFLYGNLHMRQTALELTGIWLGLIAISTPISAFVCNMLSKRNVMRLRNRLLSHILQLPRTTIDRRTKGDLLSIATNDLGQIESIFDGDLATLIYFCVMGLVSFVGSLWLNRPLAILQLGFVLLTSFIGAQFGKPLGRLGRIVQTSLGHLVGTYGEMLSGYRTVQLFGLQSKLLRRFGDVNDEITHRQRDIAQWEGLLDAFNQFMSVTSYILIFGVGAWLVSRGNTNWGTIVAVMSLKPGVGDIGEIGGAWARLHRALAGAQRVFQLLDEPSEPIQRPASIDELTRGTVNIRELTFGYTDDRTVLNNLSLALKPGQSIAIIGQSGCGKSTLAKLIVGLYSPQKGSIESNGTVAYIPQDPFIFDDSIYQNILYGQQSATREQVIQAAILANADEFIRLLPNGYDTRAGERGTLLSGGQAQRIAIARAFLMNPDILVLDEPTSALDSLAEQEVLGAMRRLMQHRTTLLITHRLETLRDADVVYRFVGDSLVPCR